MAKLTREQYNKWNAQAQNGFMLDLQYFLIWGEKTLIKGIEQENGAIIRFKLSYIDEFETRTNEHGCRWNERTGRSSWRNSKIYFFKGRRLFNKN